MASQESGIMSDGTYTQLAREVHDDLPCIDESIDHLLAFEEKFDISQQMQDHLLTNEEKYVISHQMEVSEQHLPLQSQMPTNEEFPGKYNFQVMPDAQDDTKSWVYSQKCRKVFIEMEKTLPVRVKWSPIINGLYVRAVMAYCQATHRSEAVTRCHNHIALSNPESPHLHHVVSCRHTQASYQQMNGHYSVQVPLGSPQPGSDYVQMDLTFHCKNSCSTGINRRPTEIVFNLETYTGEVVGRRKLFVRICSCPKRDKDKEERGQREYQIPKKRKLANGKKYIPIYREAEPDSEVITMPPLRIYGRENFETLKNLAAGLMLTSIERGGPAAIIRPLIDELLRQ